MKVEHESAFVLHTRAYRETSQLVDLLTPNFGRVRVVAKGSRKHRKLQPFTGLKVSWLGENELKTLTGSEFVTNQLPLKGVALYSGLYLNELLVRLVRESDSHWMLFESYSNTLAGLSVGEELEVSLRKFEFLMLQELGYGLELGVDVTTGEAIMPGVWYQFEPEVGFQKKNCHPQDTRHNWFLGESILAICSDEYGDITVRRDAKRLARLAFKPLLGSKPLQSRALFTQPVRRS